MTTRRTISGKLVVMLISNERRDGRTEIRDEIFPTSRNIEQKLTINQT